MESKEDRIARWKADNVDPYAAGIGAIRGLTYGFTDAEFRAGVIDVLDAVDELTTLRHESAKRESQL